MQKSRDAQKALVKNIITDRCEFTHNLIDVIMENQDYIMQVVMDETGKPIQEAMSMEIFCH